MDATDTIVSPPLLSNIEFESYHTYHHDTNNTIVNIDHEPDEEFLDDDDDSIIDCVICLEPITQYTAYYFDCSHKLHTECFHQYFSYNYDVENNLIYCPVCRQEMRVEVRNDKCSRSMFLLRASGALTICSFSVWLMLKYLNYSENLT